VPSPILLTEAALMFTHNAVTPRPTSCSYGQQFEVLAKLHGIDTRSMDATILSAAKKTCRSCACRKACRRWLRTGTFQYPGDPRCLNAALLRPLGNSPNFSRS